MSSVSFIADGYIQPGYIQAVARLHKALRFHFRPLLSAQRSALVQAAQGATATQFDQQARELLADSLLDWSLTDPTGDPVAVSRQAIDRLQPELFLKLYRIVFGYDPSEIDPRWPPEQQDALEADARAAESSGQTIGELREERDEKN